jgi:hypothetical protein
MLLQIADASRRVILDIFQGRAQSGIAACHDPLHQAGRDVVGRWTFRSVEHTEPPGRSRADVDEPPSLLHARNDTINGGGNRGQITSDGLSHLAVCMIDDAQHVQRGQLVDRFALRIASLGRKMLERCHSA